MTATEIKKAFKEGSPVWYHPPNEKPIECSGIIEVIYSKGKKGNMICSCLLQDAKCSHSVMRVRGRYVKAKP